MTAEPTARGLVSLERYFEAMRSHRWEVLASCLAPDVQRTGPYDDVVEGRQEYVDFLSRVLPTLPNYSLTVSRIAWTDPCSAVVQLTETLDVDGAPKDFREVLLFELDDEGRIRRVDVYVKQDPPGARSREPDAS